MDSVPQSESLDVQSPELSVLDLAIERYSIALSVLEKAGKSPLEEQVLEVLLARDAVENSIDGKTEVSPHILLKLVQLDTQIKYLADPILSSGLIDWRTTFHPSEAAWWWWLELAEAPKKRLSWLTDTVTVLCLLLTSSLIGSIHPRFAIGGLSILEAFGVITQSGLTLLLAGGSLTDSGQKTIQRILQSFRLPKSWQSEISCALSVLLFLSALALNQSLPSLSNYYYKMGVKALSDGKLKQAENAFEQALVLDPENTKVHLKQGEVLEGQLKFDEAMTEYHTALLDDEIAAFSHLGRLYVQNKNYEEAIPLLYFGIFQTEDEVLKYPMLKTLGWALLKEKRYKESQAVLEEAVKIDEKQSNPEGLSHCILAELMVEKSDQANFKQYQSKCLQYGENAENFRQFNWYNNILQRSVLMEQD